jgi:hypothetical protein
VLAALAALLIIALNVKLIADQAFG